MEQLKYRRIVLKLSGHWRSGGFGIDRMCSAGLPPALKKRRTQGEIAIVVGGISGESAAGSAQGMDRKDCNYMGMLHLYQCLGAAGCPEKTGIPNTVQTVDAANR